MQLDHESLKLIQETACKAQAAEEITEESYCERFGERIFRIGNLIERVALSPPVRRHYLRSLEDLIAMANWFAGTEENPDESSCKTTYDSVVWHDTNGVVIIIDDNVRRDKATFPLDYSQPFLQLQYLERDKPQMEQRQFIRCLRIDLGMPNEVVAPFRKLNWAQSVAMKSHIGQAQESLGRAVDASVMGNENLPDEMVIPVPIYCAKGETRAYNVSCALEVDTTNQKLMLCPLPGELDDAIHHHQADIRRRLDEGLADAKIPIYFGSP